MKENRQDTFNISPSAFNAGLIVTLVSGEMITMHTPEGMEIARRMDEVINRESEYILRGNSPVKLNSDASANPQRDRALHRVVRALHDGNCPACGLLTDSDAVRCINGNWRCPRCAFGFTPDEAEAAMEAFRPYMRANLDEFEKWRQERKVYIGKPVEKPVGENDAL